MGKRVRGRKRNASKGRSWGSFACEALARFVRDEDGQATTEYVLLLAVLAGTILTLGTAFRKKLKGLIEGRVGNYLASQFFNPGSMHTFVLNVPKQ